MSERSPDYDAPCGADFSRVMAHLEDGICAHADRDGLTGVMRAVFIDRGGHAPGEACPTAEPRDPHDYWCRWPDDECACVTLPAERGTR